MMKKYSSKRDPTTNPWVPMTKPIDLKHLGKLGEELCEAGSATFRCIIQGIDEREPVTGKLNRDWLEEELADVEANIELVKKHFKLNQVKMMLRKHDKKLLLSAWHNSLITKETFDALAEASSQQIFKKHTIANIVMVYGIVSFIAVFLACCYVVWTIK